ncbi:PAS domain-containing sensor histidine kinase [Methylotenera sp.]|uniref:sensor histidine kinase n=1 Tax=Methylotenera sp. TaxID=2051956 RepID=UPI0024882B02|nr:HAMP domain-containing sensor histidine kinase [Methylotenera sp.]MDI1297566.1 HAMP domain-containing sensor histidine kinase [Methylotenera sp.]
MKPNELNIETLNTKVKQSLADSIDLSLQRHAINILNVFRFVLSIVFIVSYLYLGKDSIWQGSYAILTFKLSIAYFIFSIFILFISPLKSDVYRLSLPLQITADIVFIILFMFAAGGITSGLGLLLVIIIVIASLVSNGRLALFYAAIATIGLLLEQSYRTLLENLSATTYTQPVMLSLSCFATAWLAYSLAKRIQHSEALASARGIDIENLSQVNGLITQEMQDGIIVVDENLNIRHSNLQATTLLSLAKNSETNFTLTKQAPEIAAIFNAWVNGADEKNNSNISIGNRELKLRFMPINQQQDSPLSDRSAGAVIFVQDLSQLQTAAQQAKLAALGRLTANIAHEIRNPLSAISHANQLLQEDESNSKSTERLLEIVADNIGRIDQIIKDVLELNRRDRTQQEIFEVSDFLNSFYAQFCAVEKVPNTHFQLDNLSQKSVSFDKRHLTQILWNLCKNGWEHSQKQAGSLKIICSEFNRSDLSIQIIDDGDGVADQDQSRLFEPFFTTKNTGNGLGLYISRELAEANGAKLKYQALANGSVFILQLKKA